MSTRRRGALLTIAIVLVAAACGGSEEPDIAAPPASGATTEGSGGSVAEARATTGSTVVADGTTLVAQASGDRIDVWDSPTDNNPPQQTLDGDDEPSGKVVLVVKQELGPNWLEVWLPGDAPGTSGWVDRDDVTLSRHRFRIEVTLSSHRLAVYAGDVQALETPVAVGPDAPAPGPGLYIKDLIQTPGSGGIYGRYAYGLSGSTNTAEEFVSGSGIVGLHGTNDEATLGRDVSRGSLAIGREPLERLVGSIGLPLGTPVEIVA